MKKIELGLLFFFIIISTIYSYKQPDATVESLTVEKEITIYVEGLQKQNLVFSEIPTINMVFHKLQIDNIYGFEPAIVLEDKQILYIPETVEGRISLNQGTKEELMTIKGIGDKTATKIIEQRKIEAYKTIEDIQKVSGIGEKTYYRIREFLCL